MQKKLKEIIRSTYGFTLVELMVVVAIIGILASIAIPNYQRYQSKARQTEAKIGLAAIYTAEKGYVVESGTYSACIVDVGYAPTGDKQFYAIGFGNGATGSTTCGQNGNLSCNKYYSGSLPSNCTNNLSFYNATAKASSALNALPTATALNNSNMTQSTFTAEAAGNISTSLTTFDTWQITDANSLTNTVNAL